MGNLVSFNFENSNVRVIEKDGEPYFVGKDVATILGYGSTKDMTRVLDEDEKVGHPIPTLGGIQEMTLINESGLYSVILTSRKPEAKKFKKWITSEVLPSIRKNGGYIANQEQLTPEQIVANALVVAQNIISQQQQKLVTMKPKAEAYDKFMNSKATYTTTELAKQLGTTAVKLNKFLRDNGIKMNNGKDLPKSGYEGWFEVIDRVFTDNANNVYTKPQCRIKPEGIHEIRKLFI